jgi:deoxyribose-phosphate aldolase
VEHKGIEYQILQMANPSGWRWVVHLGVDNIKTGVANSKGNATFKAVKLIDSAIKDVKGD